MASNEAFSHEFVPSRAEMGTVMRKFWEIVNKETSPMASSLIEKAWLADALDGKTTDGQDRVSVFVEAMWKRN